jgi:hypothetical protein
MKTVIIETHDTEAFDSFEITERELDLLNQFKMTEIEMRSIEFRILSKLTLTELAEFAKEAKEENQNILDYIHAVVNLAIGDYVEENA